MLFDWCNLFILYISLFSLVCLLCSILSPFFILPLFLSFFPLFSPILSLSILSHSCIPSQSLLHSRFIFFLPPFLPSAASQFHSPFTVLPLLFSPFFPLFLPLLPSRPFSDRYSLANIPVKFKRQKHSIDKYYKSVLCLAGNIQFGNFDWCRNVT